MHPHRSRPCPFNGAQRSGRVKAFGAAGALQPEIKLGDPRIPTASVREEGTTRQYVPFSYPAVADLDVTVALREAARKLGFRHHCGIGHCKDAFFIEGLPPAAENRMKWDARYKSNVLSPSMEAAADGEMDYEDPAPPTNRLRWYRVNVRQ